MRLERIDLADLGNPTQIARAVLAQAKLPPGSVPVEEIARALDIQEIQTLDTDAFEGALITDAAKSTGVILVRKSYPERRRYTIGHELGHFLCPYHVPHGAGFHCSTEDMLSEGTGKPNWEADANVFAAELLMPYAPFLQDVRKGSFELERLIPLAKRYEVSKTACVRRAIGLKEYIAAAFLSKGQRVVSPIYRSEEFPFVVLKKGMQIPRGSLTHRFQGAPGALSSMDSSEFSFWTDAPPRNREIFEQVLVQENGFRLTLLVLEET